MALININIDIGKGEFVSVSGPAGSGKSSLFNILGLLDKPDSGEIYFMGKECAGLSLNQLEKLRKGNIGYIFKNSGLVDELTIFSNIELPLLYLNVSRKKRKEMVNELLSEYKLEHKRNSYPDELTKFQQQMVSIARAIVFKPGLLLADEPAGSLNSLEGGEILETLSLINQDGTSVLFFTNSMQEAQRAGRVIQLFDGHTIS